MHSLTFQGFWGVGDEAGDRKGYEALVASSNPRHGDKVIYFPAACPKTGQVEWMELERNSKWESSVAFSER